MSVTLAGIGGQEEGAMTFAGGGPRSKMHLLSDEQLGQFLAAPLPGWGITVLGVVVKATGR